MSGMVLMQVGCTTYSYTSRSTTVDRRVINSTETTANVEVNYQKKVTATSDFQKTPNQARQQAVYQCIMNNGIDVLVDPIFQVENRPVTGYRATVLGFAGYYKVGLNGLDEVIDKKYNKEDIEKYLMLTDPNFIAYYYQKDGGNGNTYNIKCVTTTPSKASTIQVGTPAPKKQKAKKEKKHGKLAKFFGIDQSL